MKPQTQEHSKKRLQVQLNSNKKLTSFVVALHMISTKKLPAFNPDFQSKLIPQNQTY